MDQAHKDLIRSHYMQLSEAISERIDDIAKFLYYHRKIFTKRMFEDIVEANNTSSKKADKLLETLPSRGGEAFDALYEAVLAVQLGDAANILKPEKGDHWDLIYGRNQKNNNTVEHTEGPASGATALLKNSNIPTPDDEVGKSKILPFPDLPDNWPTEEHLKDLSVKMVDIKSDSEILAHYTQSLNGKAHYVMMHKPRGRAVIINNHRFDNPSLGQRDGTQKDGDAMKDLFQNLGFTVKTYKDLKYKEILDILNFEKEQIEPTHDCFVLIILSHGFDGHIYGTDGSGTEPRNAVKVSQIRDMFCNVQNLINKPKLFFIQACRSVDSKTQSDGKTAEELDKLNSQEVKKNLEDLVELQSDGKSPSHADCLIAMSTTSGNVSWRHKELGTWFIQAVAYIFSKFAYQYDLNALMTMVNLLVADSSSYNGKEQVSERTDTFRRLYFYFFPGLNEETYNIGN